MQRKRNNCVIEFLFLKHRVTFIFLLLQLSGFCQNAGIIFSKLEYEEVFQKAPREKKGIMLYFHFDGCGACTKMEKTVFANNEVRDYINRNFICYEVNTRKGKGIEINKGFNVELHPTFIFYDTSGIQTHKIVGVFSPSEFMNHAQISLNSSKTLLLAKSEYKKGNRESNFVREYIYLLRDASELDSTTVITYFRNLRQEQLKKEENIKLLYEFCVHRSNAYIKYGTATFDFIVSNKTLFEKYFENEQIETRIVWICHQELYEAIAQNNKVRFETILELLKTYQRDKNYYFKEIDGRVTGVISAKYMILQAKMDYNEAIGDTVKYNEVLNEYIKTIWNDPEELNNFSWRIFLEDTKGLKLSYGLKCSERSVILADNYSNNDTYANLLYKASEFKKALKYSKKAIKHATIEKADYSSTIELKTKIEKRLSEN